MPHANAHVRQIAVMLVVLVAVALAVAGGWVLLAGGAYVERLGLALCVLAGLVMVTGGTLVSRLISSDARALLGAGPERGGPYSGQGLTHLGVALFVCLPLVVAGLALVDAGR